MLFFLIIDFRYSVCFVCCEWRWPLDELDLRKKFEDLNGNNSFAKPEHSQTRETGRAKPQNSADWKSQPHRNTETPHNPVYRCDKAVFEK